MTCVQCCSEVPCSCGVRTVRVIVPAAHAAEMSRPGKCVIHSTLLAERCVHVGG